MLLGAMIALAISSAPTELYDYLARPAPEFHVELKTMVVVRDDHGESSRTLSRHFEMRSHTWQGRVMRHGVSLVEPPTVEHKGVALLVVTGDAAMRDISEAQDLAKSSGMPVAMVFDVPNQPIFDLREDALIAHTFAKFLETDDATWPLLFPMVRGALHAMDAVEQVTAGEANPIKRFVATGASKRGWTTWFLGAARDPRVIGIAPLVYDNLDIPAQMKHQVEMFGEFSERIADYRDLQAMLETPKGRRLASIVDPFSYRSEITAPTLILNGANDPYWPVDALSLYWDRLPMPKWARILPNNGHTFTDKEAEIEVLGMFARSCAGEFAMPRLEWTLTPAEDGRSVDARLKGEGVGFARFAVWMASSKTLDFRESKWSEVAVTSVTPPSAKSGPFAPAIRCLLPEGNVAVMAQVTFRIGGRELTLSLPVKVIRAKEGRKQVSAAELVTFVKILQRIDG